MRLRRLAFSSGVLLLGGVLAATTADAAPTTGDYTADRLHRVRAGAELDPALGFEIGYGRGFVLPRRNRMIVVDGALTLPFLAPGNFDLEASVHGLAVHRRDWGLRVHGGLSYVNASNEVSAIRSFAIPLSTAGGYFGYRFFAAAQAQWRPIAVTYVDHRFGAEQLLVGISDGYVRRPGGHVGFGVTGGITLARRVELAARVGVRLTQGFELSLVPVYATLAVNVRY